MNASKLLVSLLLPFVTFAANATLPISNTADAAVQGAAGARQIYFDTDQMLALKPNSLLHFNVPGVGTLPVVFEHSTGLVNGVAYWEGYAPDARERRVSLKYDGTGWSGTIQTTKGTLQVGHANGQAWVTTTGADHPITNLSGIPSLLSVKTDAVSGYAKTHQSPTKASVPISLNLAEMATMAENTEIALNLPGKGAVPIVFERREITESGNTNWIGYVRDLGTDFRVILTYGEHGAVGSIFLPDGDFQVEMQGAQQWLVDVKQSGLTVMPEHGIDALTPPVGAAAAVSATTTAKSSTTPAKAPSVAADTTATAPDQRTTVDLLVLYTDGLAKQLGDAMTLRLDNLIALTNQAYVDSNIRMKVRVVAAKQVAYTDDNDNSVALSDLTYGKGAFSTVAALRNEVGADLVTLVRPFNKTQISCGVGYVLGSSGSMIGWGGYAFSVVGNGRDYKGTSLYCLDNTLPHELTHNMGSQHDRATTAKQGNATGVYPYSYGYGVSGKFGTIMSYLYPRLNKFSNPAVTTCLSQACGVSETDLANSANNALSLNKVRDQVAAFRATKIADVATTKISGVVTAAGSPLAGVFFRPSDAKAFCGGSGTTGVYACKAPASWIGKFVPVLAGYTFTPAAINVVGGVVDGAVNLVATKP